MRSYNTVRDSEENGEGGLESSEEGLEQVAGCGGHHCDAGDGDKKVIDKRTVPVSRIDESLKAELELDDFTGIMVSALLAL